jgi:hypothetical protein
VVESFRVAARAIEKLRFPCGSRMAIFSAMSAIFKTEEFVAVEAAVT